MSIHILSDDLAAKIAAGEVIERPASVVKELVDNSIDAGAREIKIEIRGGGQRLIRVADDGDGIPANQVVTAFARHATSKLNSADDLFALETLGFRGEALPSIAAVARVTLITRARGENAGTQIRVDGSEVLDQHAQGAPQGTIITVEDLFRHVPARLKFLKQPSTEAAHIADLVNAYALAFPHLRFSLVNEERLVFQAPGTGKLSDALVKVLGSETANQMIEVGNCKLEVGSEPPNVQLPASNIQVYGFVSPPALNRATRKQMWFFVNHRWVQDRALQHAVIEAYHTALMVGRSPIAVIDIQVPPSEVDVNVHPTKSQVRFRDSHAVFVAAQRAVRTALTAHAPIPTITISPPVNFAPTPTETQLAIDLQRPITNYQLPIANSQSSNHPTTQPPNKLPMLRVLGQILSTYIIAEGADGLYLIDQHAAHERVLYEQIQSERVSATVATQDLLDPLSLQLTPSQVGALDTHHAELESVGFRIEPFGNQTVLLRAIPAAMKKRDPGNTLAEILDELEQGEQPLEKSAEARLITSVCKSIAVKGGQVLSLEEMRELIRLLEQTTAPRTCPHGRPTMIALNAALLEREFGRK